MSKPGCILKSGLILGAVCLLALVAAVVIFRPWVSGPKPGATPTPEPPPTQAEKLRTLTITDADLTPLLPVKGAWLHFLPGNALRVGYGKLGKRITVGISEGKLWFSGMPIRVAWPMILGIDKNAADYCQVSEDRIWLTAIPPWFDLSRFDKDLTKLPTFISLETREGEATITYIPEGD